jgi:NitT/TauT family transport system ATP-binding protein
MLETIIEARGLEKFYGEPGANVIQVIAPTDISVHAGEILAVLGPSGSGKSTLLRMLTGLSKPSAGEVLWHGKPVTGQSPNVSIVFQSFALFPWLTVLENVEAPLKARGIAEIPRRKRSLKILETVGLDGFEAAYPKELSGGMKQRVGLARALAVEPRLLLMDEPFSALDALTAITLREELLDIWQSPDMPVHTIVIVTHIIEEAVELADRILVLAPNPGRLVADLKVDLPRPRDRRREGFNALTDQVFRLIEERA